jgi:hypothetical protein
MLTFTYDYNPPSIIQFRNFHNIFSISTITNNKKIHTTKSKKCCKTQLSRHYFGETSILYMHLYN